MKYVDTSVLVSAVVPERTTEAAIAWLSAQTRGSLVVSDWTPVEFCSALVRKVRMDRLKPEDYHLAMAEFDRTLVSIVNILRVEQAHFSRAAKIVADHVEGIRPGDALHLAVAFDRRATLCTFDKKLAAGAQALGYDVELIV